MPEPMISVAITIPRREPIGQPQDLHQGLYGLDVEAAQHTIHWGLPEEIKGLAIFGVFTVSDQNTAKFKYDYEAGFASRGVFPSRPVDLLSLGWVQTTINPRFRFLLAQAGLPIQTSEQLSSSTTPFSLPPH
jgi:carbohydrate-selective porin OprB